MKLRASKSRFTASATALPTASPAGGTGAAAGGWDTSGNRDTGIACVTTLITITTELQTALNKFYDECANNAGTNLELFRGKMAKSLTSLPTASPAGGTGATGGCYDTSGHRDAFITTINTLRTIAGELKTMSAAVIAEIDKGGLNLRFAKTLFVRSNTAIPAVPSAGGAGAAAGGWDTSGNRDTGITCINSVRTICGELQTAVNKIIDELNG
jgi:hypothetical protein